MNDVLVQDMKKDVHIFYKEILVSYLKHNMIEFLVTYFYLGLVCEFVYLKNMIIHHNYS